MTQGFFGVECLWETILSATFFCSFLLCLIWVRRMWPRPYDRLERGIVWFLAVGTVVFAIMASWWGYQMWDAWYYSQPMEWPPRG